MHLILASASRDRKKCFIRANVPVEVIPSDFNENSISINDPIQLVQKLAIEKAKIVVDQWKQNRESKEGPAVIIGADTMVLFENQLIGKAQNKEHAFKILSTLSGKTHELLTGVALIETDQMKTIQFWDKSEVHFQELTSNEIWDYLNITDEYIGRAGAYSLQERASLFIDKISGSPSNVLGLPMAKLRSNLKQFGINLLNNQHII